MDIMTAMILDGDYENILAWYLKCWQFNASYDAGSDFDVGGDTD